MATIRERRPGVWEVRVFSGRDASGRPVQTSRTVKGTKRDAMRLAASFDSRPATHAAGRTVADILNAWVEVNQEVWAESSRRDQEGRVAKVLADPIASVPVSRLGVADVERWHARMRRAGVRGDGDPQPARGAAGGVGPGRPLGVDSDESGRRRPAAPT